MTLRLLQLNIYMGKYMSALLPFLKKESYDILSLQEVSGGDVSFNRRNTFQQICDLGYDGQLLVVWRLNNRPNAFFGQAVFFKRIFTLLQKDEVWLKPYMELKNLRDPNPRDQSKAALGVKLEKDGEKFSVISAHLAWSPRADDTNEKVRQGKLFQDYLKKLHDPFVLTGDFNLASHTKVVRMLTSLGTNHITKNHISNTINPRLHRDRERIFPKGVAVDYIITSPGVKVETFKVLEDLDLSDHLGLSAALSM